MYEGQAVEGGEPGEKFFFGSIRSPDDEENDDMILMVM